MQTTVISFRQANRKIDHLRQTKQESKCSSIKNKKLIDETIVYLKQPGADLELSQGGGGGRLPTFFRSAKILPTCFKSTKLIF